MTTKAEAFAGAAAQLNVGFVEQDERSPYEAAVAAWRPGGPDLAELEAPSAPAAGLPINALRHSRNRPSTTERGARTSAE